VVEDKDFQEYGLVLIHDDMSMYERGELQLKRKTSR